MASSKHHHQSSLHLSPLSSFDSLGPLSSFTDSQLFESATQPHSLGSEPEDIGRWFSSYDYESPSQDSFPPHFDFDSFRREERIVVVGEDATDSPHQPEALVPAKGINPLTAGGDARERHETTQAGDTSLQIAEVKITTIRAKSIVKGKCSSKGDPNEIGEDEPSLRSDLSVQPCSLRSNCPARSPEAKVCSPSILLPKESSNPESNCAQANTEARAKHQSSGCGGNGDGWVSTRNLRDKVGWENSRKAGSILREEKKTGNLNSSKKTNSTVGRGGATEDAKLNEVERATEITGKWRCPGKRKVDLGPPLKQVGLERWVRRLV